MSGNSGSGGPGKFARESFDRERYERSLMDFRDVLDHAEVVGWPKQSAELYELERLVAKYPAKAEEFLAQHRRGTQP